MKRVGLMKRVGFVPTLFCVVACQGARVGESTDAAPSDTSTSDTSTDALACAPPDEKNLLSDPSFEVWNDSGLIAWEGKVEQTTKSGDVLDCKYGALVRNFHDTGIKQTWTPSEPLPAGAELEAHVWGHWVSGANAPPILQLTSNPVVGSLHESGSGTIVNFKLDGVFREAVAKLTLNKAAASIEIVVAQNAGLTESAFVVDRASLVRIK